ncbi:DMT family transporter [Flavimaricola marinus]|uniref:EamA-like transporter family protein n=1 Tax=Flavimaricola marinus TaxID=1819565 RepID=A0A238LDK2_9RHOB|nr:DMT family transporter [Flavimaricola marinus]SMY07036.1 EamA-like transporter family protein [Flavimaricola marinus]
MTTTTSWRTILMICASTTLVVIGDAAGTKLTAAGFSQTFVAWARFALAAILIAPFCGVRLAETPKFFDWRLILRGALISAAVICILQALRTEPMANVFGGFFVSPIVSYFLSALVLKERITLPRTLLLLVSFAGVLIVVRPGFGMSAGMLTALLAGALHGSYLVATRWLAGGYRPRFLLLSQLVIGGVLLIPFAFAALPPITGWAVLFLVISSLGSAGGNMLLVLVNRVTPAGVVAPLIYFQLVAAVGVGWVAFGQWPDLISLTGLTIIAVAGVSSVWFAGRGR